MKPVTLYTTNKRKVSSHCGYIPVTSVSSPLIKCVNSLDMFIENEIKVDHLPVRRFCFTQDDNSVNEIFVAFDRELDDVIQVMLDDYTSGIQFGYRKSLEAMTTAYEKQIKRLESRTIWDMIKLKFSKWWLK